MPRKRGPLPDGPRGIRRFNEAEAEMPRKPARKRIERGYTRCFNEAEAEMPRKRRWPTATTRRAGGFNEAEAEMPRKPIDNFEGQLWVATLQ